LYSNYLDYTANLLINSSSFLHGQSPEFNPVPVYAVASSCCSLKTSQSEDAPFEITYWLFFPFSEGKEICTISAGALGPVPFPWLRKACLGKVKRYGSHLGDWEHVTLSFPVSCFIMINEGFENKGIRFLATSQVTFEPIFFNQRQFLKGP